MKNDKDVIKIEIADLDEDIAEHANIERNEAIEVIIKLLFIDIRLNLYVIWDTKNDYFTVNKCITKTEIVYCKGDGNIYVYNVQRKKYYKQYWDPETDDVIQEEIKL